MSISTKFAKKRPEKRPMLQPLGRFLNVDLDPVMSTELEQFAEEHKHYVSLSDDKTTASFSAECHTFKIRADYDSRIDKTVYQGLVEGHAPYEVLFDTGYRASVDEVLTYLKVGIQNLGLDRGGGDLEDEDEDEVFDA